ncbi:conserved protein of unknown function [Limnospira indica PCC 8005]|uniref:Uncharacterized protein n=1 Tax=Limnospira indica PCC 8005 TaxID=376219 RepID=A0A9P1P1S9_9CYAN|nr:conserved protein of unknown function [Limnospira indica PCC 8005]
MLVAACVTNNADLTDLVLWVLPLLTSSIDSGDSHFCCF